MAVAGQLTSVSHVSARSQTPAVHPLTITILTAHLYQNLLYEIDDSTWLTATYSNSLTFNYITMEIN